MSRRLLAALALLAAPSAASAQVSAVATADGVEFRSGSEVVAKYHTAPTVAKPFLWPVAAPGGTPVTRAWPIQTSAADATTDHIHQKSVWFCHGDVIPEGLAIKTPSAVKGDKGVDFWSEAKDKDGKKRHGTIRCTKVAVAETNAPGTVTVVTLNVWLTADGEKILDEKRTITFRETPQGRLFTFTCELVANDYPIVFGDTKEGSFGVRVHDELRTVAKDGGTVTPSDGAPAKAGTKDNLPLWGKVAGWNDYSGTVGGKAVGLAVFAHPSNPTKSAWHTRAYGLMAANPFAREHSGFPSQKGKTDLVRLEKGKSLTYQFGAYAHTGDVTSGKVAEAYEAFKK
ncbi:PmoA family protein [bacterium]|nr:PmoA family protein [bacterium]